MELYKEILAKVLQEKEICVAFAGLQQADPNELVKAQCYQALERIRAPLGKSELSDFDCIEEIVHILESIGIDGNGRHDF